MSREVILVAGHGELGGGEVMLLACARAAISCGVRPVVVAPASPDCLARAARETGCTVRRHPAADGDSWWRTAAALRRTVVAARREHRSAPVWCHGLRPAAATVGLPGRVVHVHRVPTLFQKIALLAAVAGARVVLAPSVSTRSLLPGPLARATQVFANWTDDVSVPGRAFHGGGRRPVIGYLGRVAREKGLDDLVSAIQLIEGQGDRGILLRVGGEAVFVSDREAGEIFGRLEQLGTRVLLDGWAERGLFLSRVDVLVCPSRVPESFGLVVAEAMAAGVPVVVSDAGALPEVVGPDHPYIARAGDPVSLAGAVRRALDELGTPAGDAAVARARRRWEDLWSPAAGRQRVVSLLRDLGVVA